MTKTRTGLRCRRRDETGATLIEFAIVVPVALMLIFGIVAGCYLAYQNSALHDGATAGARMASIETSLVTPDNGQYCESALPTSIQTAVAKAAPLLTVNPAPLCAASSTATTLTQGPDVAGDVNITVTCGGSCATPTTAAVSLAFSASGLVTPFGHLYRMTATSQVPILSP